MKRMALEYGHVITGDIGGDLAGDIGENFPGLVAEDTGKKRFYLLAGFFCVSRFVVEDC